MRPIEEEHNVRERGKVRRQGGRSRLATRASAEPEAVEIRERPPSKRARPFELRVPKQVDVSTQNGLRFFRRESGEKLDPLVDEGRPMERHRVQIETVARKVAREMGLEVADLKGPGRAREESRAWALVPVRARDEAGISLARSARYFDRDDSTIVRAVARLLAANEK